MLKILKKRKNFTKNDILKSFFLLFVFVLAVFVFINHQYLQFAFNGFQELCKADLQVYYLDVGQASASVIVFPNGQSMIIDTGSQDSEKDFIENVEIIFDQNNIKKVDYLILSHSDEDHVGGASKLLQKFQVDTVYRPKLYSTSDLEMPNVMGYKKVTTQVYEKTITSVLSEPNCEVLFMEDEVLDFGHGVSVEFWAANNETYTATNSYSPFVTISFADRTFMFACDTTSVREYEFLNDLEEKQEWLTVDFLAVAHHGSAYSTTENFLKTINPQYAFISAGDKYHPNLEVLLRLENAGVEKTYITKSCGMIAVGLNENESFSIKFEAVYVDLPLIVVILICFAFAVAKINFNYGKRAFFKKTDKIF